MRWGLGFEAGSSCRREVSFEKSSENGENDLGLCEKVYYAFHLGGIDDDDDDDDTYVCYTYIHGRTCNVTRYATRP